MHVILDTSIYRHDPQRRKAAFEALTTLAANNHITLHVPHVVKGEFLSFKKKNCQTHANSIEVSAKKLLAALGTANEEMEDLYNNFLTIKDNLDALSQNDFMEWVQYTGAVVHPILANHAEHVFDLYFKGNPPFKGLKAREDIPDAFIFQSVASIASDKQVIFICNDKNLGKTCSAIANVTLFSSLKEFIDSDQCQALLKEQVISDNYECIVDGLKECAGEIEGSLDGLLLKALPWTSFNDENIPSDDNEATIQGVGASSDVELEFGELSYCGKGVFTLPFTCNLSIDVYYYVFKSDAYCDEERFQSVSLSEHNDHYFEAEEEVDVSVNGTFKIAINMDDLDIQDIEDTLMIEDCALESVDVTELLTASFMQ